ncbi:cytochrome c1 [Anaplasma platys]|uniref:Cytochrome c1 n=1 Tax=Anaplasma platys TaxID=949 RepID=A0A858PXW3_9RICK|nr:cytochrome c1 [Anaplasma platys]QJC27446.1 cytochrome c1 [Anaplasma platys]
MMRLTVFWVLLLFVSPVTGFVHGAVGGKVPKWSFSGIMGKVDKPAVQRGYQVYKEVCASCHSMKRIAFRNLREIGFTEAEVKALAASYTYTDGPDENGDMFERPGIPSDYFPNPFPNRESAAASNNGAFPPDLSLITKARHNGPDYVYRLMTGYESTEPDESGLYANPFFPAGKIAMAPPLSKGLVSYMDDTEPTIENMARDVVNFLQWAAEPEMESRKKLGIKVVMSLTAGTILVIFVNRRLWSTLKK